MRCPEEDCVFSVFLPLSEKLKPHEKFIKDPIVGVLSVNHCPLIRYSAPCLWLTFLKGFDKVGEVSEMELGGVLAEATKWKLSCQGEN